MVSEFKLKQNRAVREGIRHASKMQKMNFRAQMVTVKELLKEKYIDEESSPGDRKAMEERTAFTIPGGLDIWINTDRLHQEGGEELSADVIMFLINHETGHLSLTPVYFLGDYHEVMSIIHQPDRPYRFPVTFLHLDRRDRTMERGKKSTFPASMFSHLLTNLYQDCIINFTILENPYTNKHKEVKLALARGIVEDYAHLIQTGDPPYVDDVWRDIPVQAARRTLANEGIEPYVSEGYGRHEDLKKMEELNFRFNERNREAHNRKLAEFMWWLRFVKKDDFLVRHWSDERIEEMASLEKNTRDEVIEKEVIKKFAKRIILEESDPPVMEWEITSSMIRSHMPQAKAEFDRVYEETYGIDEERFASEIGIEKWDDVKDRVIGAGVDLDEIRN